MLRAWHNKSFFALDRTVEALNAGRRGVGNNIAPELRPKTNHEIHSSRGGPWLPDRRDCRSEPHGFRRIVEVKLQVRMRGGSKSEDSSLRRVHPRIIASAV